MLSNSNLLGIIQPFHNGDTRSACRSPQSVVGCSIVLTDAHHSHVAQMIKRVIILLDRKVDVTYQIVFDYPLFSVIANACPYRPNSILHQELSADK